VVGLRNGTGLWQLYCGTRCVHPFYSMPPAHPSQLTSSAAPEARLARKRDEWVTCPLSAAVSTPTTKPWRSAARDGARAVVVGPAHHDARFVIEGAVLGDDAVEGGREGALERRARCGRRATSPQGSLERRGRRDGT
jgi:hypothetical protein